MSDRHPETEPSEAAPPPSPDSQPSPDEPAAAAPASPERKLAFALAGVLGVIVLLVGTAPFWEPALPWASAPAHDDTALVQRLDRLDASLQRAQQQAQQVAQQQSAAIQPLERRIIALEARPGPPTLDIAELRQQLAKLTNENADLAARVAALAKGAQAKAADETTDMALLLAVLQIRDALQAGRPFAAEYEALSTLARARPEMAEAAAPLAEPARTGVAGRMVLATRLRDLAGTIAALKTSAGSTTAGDWTDAALNRLSGLVKIRRTDGGSVATPADGPRAVLHEAEMALAGGDLAAAVATLDKLTGAAAEAAAPWQRMARQRLAVEAALRRVEALLVARLGKPAPAGGAGSPG